MTRKQRELGAREDVLLGAAKDLLVKGGYHGLTMARIGEATGYSKGTVYQHFPCKEEVVMALAYLSIEKQQELVRRAAVFRGTSRERMLAIAEATDLFSRLYPDDARIFQIMNGEAIMQKASPESISRMRTSARETVQIMVGILRDGVAQGDLVLGDGTRPEEIIFHFWLLGEGGKAAALSWMPPSEMGIEDTFGSLVKTSLLLADGYGWQPLSTEWDYADTMRRIRAEVFPKEAGRLHDAADRAPRLEARVGTS